MATSSEESASSSKPELVYSRLVFRALIMAQTQPRMTYRLLHGHQNYQSLCLIKRQYLWTKTVGCNFNEIIIFKKIETRVRLNENKVHDFTTGPPMIVVGRLNTRAIKLVKKSGVRLHPRRGKYKNIDHESYFKIM